MILVPHIKDSEIILIDCKELGYKTRKKWYWNLYQKSEYYLEFKRDALKKHIELVGDKCLFCSENKKLQAHHNNYDCLYQEILFKDIIFLCRKCHELLHLRRNINIENIDIKIGNYSKDKTDFSWIKNSKKEKMEIVNYKKNNLDFSWLNN